MPEWTSFTFDDEGKASRIPDPDSSGSDSSEHPSSPAHSSEDNSSHSLSADEIAAKWGTDVEPLTLDRIEAVLEGDGFPHTRHEFAIITVVNNLQIRLHQEPVDSPWFQCEARPVLSSDSFPELGMEELIQAANTWNTEHLQPKATPVHLDSLYGFTLTTPFFVGAGMSDRQIHAMIRRGVTVTVQAVLELPKIVTQLKK
ncbi:YbjN domain-containing protein [Schaalia sp. ZJ1691]|uniref:YbjN domain-containing protein n=1 Tax=Schaalia sp. ZJ1691 TaxID=2709404 RepID=UPI0013EBBD7A|nr:YbjN domain-containing protein [Schaalia sp. ZJ1691]